ncbi:MAG: 4Fe-4S dicluster domain-containing protein [Candidatus Margulisiibacteriota bacterium]
MRLFVIFKTIIRSLCSKPATLMYPFVLRKYTANARGSISIKISDCIYCGICQKKCPTNAITVYRDNKAWEIDRLKCISCNCCVEVCPKKCLLMDTQYSPSMLTKTRESFFGA